MPTPRVAIRTTEEKGDWPGAKQAVAWCNTVIENADTGEIKTCAFVHVATVKVAAEEQAKWHRDWHRSNPGVAWQDRARTHA